MTGTEDAGYMENPDFDTGDPVPTDSVSEGAEGGSNLCVRTLRNSTHLESKKGDMVHHEQQANSLFTSKNEADENKAAGTRESIESENCSNRETVAVQTSDSFHYTGGLVIHPQNANKIKWDIFVSVLIIYSVLIIPYRIGFGEEAEGFAYGFDWGVDGVFFVDIILSFRTAVWDEEQLVCSTKGIARAYIKSWFLIDFFSTFPFDVVIGSLLSGGETATDHAASLRSIKMIKFFRLIRLLKLARLLKLKKFRSSLEGTVSLNPALQRLLKLLLEIVFIAHLLSCFWYFTSTIDEDSSKNWVAIHQLYDEPTDTKYLASFYWTVATMMAVGYGDIHAVNDLERCYSILVQVTGATCFGFIIANIAAFIETFDPRATAYRNRMDRVRQYMRDRGLPRPLQKRVRKYYDYILSKQSIFDNDNILAQLPANLVESLILHTHGQQAKQIHFLETEDNCFVAYIMARARVLLIISGEVVAEAMSVTTDIYMISQGQVEGHVVEYEEECSSPVQTIAPPAVAGLESFGSAGEEVTEESDEMVRKRQANPKEAHPPITMMRKLLRQNSSKSKLTTENPVTGKRVAHAVTASVYKSGSNFCEVGVVKNSPHTVTFRASKLTDLLAISKTHMEYAIYMYPSSALRFRRRTEKHKTLLQEAIASKTLFFFDSGRKIKEKVCLDGTSIVHGEDINIEMSDTSVTTKKKKKKKKKPVDTPLNAPVALQARQSTKKDWTAAKERNANRNSVKIMKKRTSKKLVTDANNYSLSTKVLPVSQGVSRMGSNSSLKQSSSNVSFPSMTSKETDEEGIDEEEEMVGEMELDQIWSEHKIIPPGHRNKIKWDLWIAALIIYSVILVPYRIGFSQQAEGGSEAFDMLVDIMFGVDILLAFRTAYVDPETDSLVLDAQDIARKYLRGWFTIDFVSTFPFDSVITSFIAGADKDAIRSLKLVKVFRMVRLLKLARLFKLKKIVGNLDSEIEIGHGVMKLVSLFFQISFVAHLFACFWFFASAGNERDAWYVLHGYSADPDVDVQAKYIASLYWSFTTMATVGYGDIAPYTNHERLYAIFIMIMGATIFGYVVGSIASLISMLDIADALYKAKMNQLDEFLSEQGIPKALRKDCKTCYAYSLSLCSVFDEKKILGCLSPALKQEILMTIHFPAVQVIPIFRSETASFIAEMLQIMDPQLGLPNTFILNYDDIGSQIFFMITGEVNVYDGAWPETDADGSVRFEKSKLHVYKPGGFFGYEAVFSGKKHKISAKCISLTQFYTLSKTAIGHMVDDNAPFALLLQDALQKARRAQDNKRKVEPTSKGRKLWGIVQNRFTDILSMSPSKMRRMSAEATTSVALERMLDAMSRKNGMGTAALNLKNKN